MEHEKSYAAVRYRNNIKGKCMLNDESLIADGEIHQSSGYWYAIYEFQSPLSDDQTKVAKRALLYRLMAFLEESIEIEFNHKIVVHKDFRQVPDFLGRNRMHNPSIGLIIEAREGNQ